MLKTPGLNGEDWFRLIHEKLYTMLYMWLFHLHYDCIHTYKCSLLLPKLKLADYKGIMVYF